MNTYSFYNIETGYFKQTTLTCAVQHLICNIPDNCCPILGEYDSLSQKVNLETGEVEDYIPPQPSENHVWNVDTKRWDYIPPRSEIETQVWEYIKSFRDKKQSGGVLVEGYWFHSDVDSRLKYLGLVAMGQNMPQGIMWKTMSGEFVTMTPTLAQQIFSAISTYDMEVFAVAENHKSAMKSSDNPVMYDFSAGWPTMFGE